MLKQVLVSVLLLLSISMAIKRDRETIKRELEERLEAIDQLVGQHDAQATCPLEPMIRSEGVCAVAQSSDDEKFLSCEDSDTEAVVTPEATEEIEAPVQTGWFSGWKGYFGY
jgi:hypothetical protein